MSRTRNICATSLRAQQDFGADRRETAAQERSERRCVPRGHLCPNCNTGFDESKPVGDQSSAGTRLGAVEALDGQLESIDQTPPDRDNTPGVGVHSNIATVLSRAHHTTVIVVTDGLGEVTVADAPSDEHGVVRTDPSVRARQPPQEIRLRCTTEPVRTAGDDIARRAVGENDGVAGELDDRVMITGDRHQHVDPAVDGRESSCSGLGEDLVHGMHSARTVRSRSCAST